MEAKCLHPLNSFAYSKLHCTKCRPRVLYVLYVIVYIGKVLTLKVVIITNLGQRRKSASNAENTTDLPETLQVLSLCCFS